MAGGGWFCFLSFFCSLLFSIVVGCALAWKVGVDEEDRLGLEGFDWKKRGCSDERSGLRLVCVHGRDVKHRFFSLKDVPEDPLGDSAAW